MKSVRRIAGILVVTLLFVLASALQAQGFYWETTVKGAPGGEHLSKSYMTPRMFKVENEDKDKTSTIVDLDKKVITMINGDDEEYSEITFDEMEAHMKKAEAKMAEMEKSLAEMPEMQRKMMEKMMGPMAGGSGPIAIKGSAEKKTILGYKCGRVDVQQGDKTIITLWVTKAVPGFEKIRPQWEEFSRRMMGSMPGNFAKGMGEAMKKVEGFPLETAIGEIVSTITKLEERAIPASTFTVPAGYDKVKSELLKADED
ncbi:MAG: DUF4412 domain-containing protein [Acidobacteriota bacterium]